jgi:hypothetical protein
MINNKTNEPRTIIKSGYFIEVTADSQIEVLEGVSQKTNKPYKMVKQEAWLNNGSRYPEKVYIPLNDQGNVLAEDTAYPEGEYLMGDAIDVGGWGDLQISRDLKLVPKVSK